jgi:hypothetical protein
LLVSRDFTVIVGITSSLSSSSSFFCHHYYLISHHQYHSVISIIVSIKVRTHDATLRELAKLFRLSRTEIVARNVAVNVAELGSSSSATLRATLYRLLKLSSSAFRL